MPCGSPGRQLWPVGLFCSPWPEQALRANIHCQISLALNRIYTEWYPSKGYTFNITNSTSYDQYYVHTYANLNENDPMPYSTGTTLRVREFRGKSASRTLWTTIAAMEAWNLTRRKYGRGIPVGYAFRRIWEGGHGTRSQHYAGVAFDVGQSLTQTERTAIYNAARNTGAWGYVEPLSQTPTWVHMDRRYGTPACSGTTAGYPTLRRGSRGCYVMILQDALSTLGYQTGSRIDGVFGARTEEALRGYQRRTSLSVDGVCGCNSWKKISTAVLGVGRTKTTID